MRRHFILPFACAILASSTGLAAVGRNGNGMSDVWEMIYNASALTAGVDTDGDGFANGAEAKAGTNPFDASSVPSLKLGFLFPSTAQLTWDSFPGKRYIIQSRAGLTGAWSNEAPFLATGDLSQTNLTQLDGAKFFRLSIDDLDSDADGVLDYEERALGFNPHTPRTDRRDQTDLFRITNELSAASVVTVSTLDPLMFERWPDPGLIAVRRSGGLLPLTVNFALNGTATPGLDYTPSTSNTISIPAGVREVWLELHPVADANDGEPPRQSP